MDDEVTSVTVVGGGDGGLLTALALQRTNPSLDIEVVDDFDESSTNVGKSTYQAIVPILHDVLGIDEGRFLREVKPVWKGSVYFRDWCGNDPFHFPFDLQGIKPDLNDPRSGEELYHYYKTGDRTTPAQEIAAQGKTPLIFSPRAGGHVSYPNVAYHLSLDRFNSFLRTLCEERGVSLTDDRIDTVKTDNDRTQINRLRGKSDDYDADLFVDATGFKRLLIGELDASFRSFDLPLDTAIHAVADRSIREIEPTTVVETGEHGWYWQIDTYDHRDLGYVFASDYVSEEEARAEFEDHCDEEFIETDVHRFKSGFYEDAWVGNCVANGNALGFVEPLQSTAVTTHAHTAIRLSRLLASHCRRNTPALRRSFDDYVCGTWNSIYDFVSIHYRFANGETDFWRDVQSIPLSEKVETYVKYFDENGFELHDAEVITRDGTTLDVMTFLTFSFYYIMAHMGGTSSFYEDNDFDVSDELTERWRQQNTGVRAMAEECLSYEEVYKSGLVDSYQRNEWEFVKVGTSGVELPQGP